MAREQENRVCGLHFCFGAQIPIEPFFFTLFLRESFLEGARSRQLKREREGAPQAHIHTHRELLLHVKLREIFSFDKVKVLSLLRRGWFGFSFCPRRLPTFAAAPFYKTESVAQEVRVPKMRTDIATERTNQPNQPIQPAS
jgi:hypothetical protein